MKILKIDSDCLIPFQPRYSVFRVSFSDSSKVLRSFSFVRLYSSCNYWKAYNFWNARKGSGVVLVAE